MGKTSVPITSEIQDISNYTYNRIIAKMDRVLDDVKVSKNSPVPIKAILLESVSASILCSDKQHKFTKLSWSTRYRGQVALVGSVKENPRYRNKVFAIATLWTIKKSMGKYEWYMVKVKPIKPYIPKEPLRPKTFFTIRLPIHLGGV